MKILCTILIYSLLCTTSVYAQEWIAYQQLSPPVVQTTSVVHVLPSPQPVVIYQWVPYTTHQSVVVEQYCLFRRIQRITTQPVTQWIYQPIVVYR